jgi:hypothetical protein
MTEMELLGDGVRRSSTNFPPSMRHESLLPCSQEPITDPCLEPHESNPPPPVPSRQPYRLYFYPWHKGLCGPAEKVWPLCTVAVPTEPTEKERNRTGMLEAVEPEASQRWAVPQQFEPQQQLCACSYCSAA